MKGSKIYILVLNWNGWQDTISCIESILLSTCDNFEIVVIDNGSEDASVEKINSWLQKNHNNDNKIKLIETHNNSGYAGGNNAGIRYALSKGDAEYIWVLNNDTIVKENTLTELYNYSEKNNIGICGSTVLYYNSSKLQCTGGALYNPFFSVNKYLNKNMDIKDIANMGDNKRLDYVAGCSMFISIDTIKKTGLLCEDYFLYYEELDYCHRAKANNTNIGWCKNSLLYHKEGASLKKGSKKRKSGISEYYGNLSALKFTEKFYRRYLVFAFINRFLLKFFKNLIALRFDLIKQLFKAYGHFILSKGEKAVEG